MTRRVVSTIYPLRRSITHSFRQNLRRMRIKHLHSWQVTPSEAVEIQRQLRGQVSPHNNLGDVHTVAGVDMGIKGKTARAVVVVLSYPALEPVVQSLVECPVGFKYIPGLLSFREAPPVLAAFEKLSVEPDLVIVDGQGIAHPRRMGIASHLGLFLDRPTIGCAKSRLCGRYKEPGEKRGSFSYLYDHGEIIGAALRTKDKTKVVYVSPGHKIDLKMSIHYVLSCCRGYRLPQPIRFAHQAAGGTTLKA